MNTEENNLENKEEQVEDIFIEEENSETTFSGKKKKDQDKLDMLLAEKQEYLDGWQRARAEMANVKKVHAEEKLLFTTLGKQSVINDLIPMLDNFDAAFSNKESWESVPETWRIGVEYIYKQFLEVLEQHGVELFGAVGDTFDATLHEPVQTVPGDEKEANTVVSVVKQGYKIGDKVLRPAKVHIGE